MMSETAKRKQEAHLKEPILPDHVIGNNINHNSLKEKYPRHKQNHHVYDNLTSSSSILPSNNYHQKQPTGVVNSLPDTSVSPTLVKQRRSTTRPSQLSYSTNITDEKVDANDKINIVYVDDDSPNVAHEIKKTKSPITDGNEHTTRPSPKLETFL